jgi:undecaprenyl phosphate N,N'-diacetylbacillosamine 1-phosphate transferase
MKIYRNFFKRFFDLTVSLLGLILLSPLFIVVCAIIIISIGEFPFFMQTRHGKNGKIFTIIKFKTWKEKRDSNGIIFSTEERAANQKRLRIFGSFLSKTSLDEVPQLINVLTGSMSIIGPRPLITEYMPFYNKFQLRRHEVRPGMSGWAQVNQHLINNHEERCSFDVWYVDNLSLGTDLKILWYTMQNFIKK